MSSDAIRQIDEVEQKALQLVADARKNALDLVEQAKKNAEENVHRERANAQTRAAEITGEAVKHRERALEERTAEARRECLRLEETARNNMHKAVSLILERVVTG